MKKIHLICLASWAALSSTNLLAQTAGQYYGGLGAGRSETSLTQNQHDQAYKVFGGYQFNPYWGLEAGYFNLGKFGLDPQILPLGSMSGSFRLDGINIDLVGNLPINDQLSILGRIGVIEGRSRATLVPTETMILSNANPERTKRDYKAGVGFSYQFSRSMSLRGDIERYRINDAVGGTANVDVTTLSLVFPFGRTAEKAPKVVERVVYQDTPQPAKEAPKLIKEEPQVVAVTPAAPPVAPVPAPVPAPTPQRMKVSFNADVLFGFDRSSISPAGHRAMDKFANEIRGVDYEQIIIVGHTDRIGNPAYNEKLSLLRANAVKSYLVSRHAAPAHKIMTISKGSTEPLTEAGACKGVSTSAAVRACLESDRRVDLEVSGTRVNSK